MSYIASSELIYGVSFSTHSWDKNFELDDLYSAAEEAKLDISFIGDCRGSIDYYIIGKSLAEGDEYRLQEVNYIEIGRAIKKFSSTELFQVYNFCKKFSIDVNSLGIYLATNIG